MSARRIVYDNEGMTMKEVRPNESSNDNTGYMIWCMAEPPKYAIYLTIAQKMINSFGFTDRY
jgi:hypothetical protein